MRRNSAPSESRLSRRRALLAGIAALIGAAAPGRSPAGQRSRIASFTGRFGLPAADVGERYLRTAPGEADVEVLADRLSERLEGLGGSLQARLEAAVREDFRSGDVVPVDRWMCSRTEARVCAIAHLTRHR